MYLAIPAHLPDLLERLHDADLVVDRHDGHEGGLRRHGLGQHVEVDQPVLLHGQVGHLEPLLLQEAARVQHALVLGLRGDDVVLLLAVEVGHALDGHVIALRGPRREDDLLGRGAQQARHLLQPTSQQPTISTF